MAIVRFSKEGPDRESSVMRQQRVAQIGLASAQRAGVIVDTASGVVDFTDKVWDSKVLNAVVDELGLRARQAGNLISGTPAPAGEQRMDRLRSEAVSAVSTKADAWAKAEGAGERQRGLQNARESFTPEQVPGFGQKPMSSRDAAISASLGIGGMQGVQATPHGRIELPAQPESEVVRRLKGMGEFTDPVDRVRMLQGLFPTPTAPRGSGPDYSDLIEPQDTPPMEAQDFAVAVKSAFGKSDAGRMAAAHLTPDMTVEQAAEAEVAAGLGGTDEEVQEAIRLASPGSATNVLEPSFDTAKHPVKPSDPRTVTGMALGRALQAAQTPDARTPSAPTGAVAFARKMAWLKALDAEQRNPQPLPEWSVLEGKSLGSLDLLAKSRMLSDDDVDLLVALARDKAVSNGLANAFGGKYKDEAAQSILDAQAAFRAGRPPMDLVKAAEQIARVGKYDAMAYKHRAVGRNKEADTATRDNLRQAQVSKTWAYLASTANSRRLWHSTLKARLPKAARGLADGFMVEKEITDTTPNNGGKSNAAIQNGLLAAVAGGGKAGKAAEAALHAIQYPYQIGNAATRITNNLSIATDKMAANKLKYDALPKSKKNGKWARSYKLAERLALAANQAMLDMKTDSPHYPTSQMLKLEKNAANLLEEAVRISGEEPDRAVARRPSTEPDPPPPHEEPGAAGGPVRPAGVPAHYKPILGDDGEVLGWGP